MPKFPTVRDFIHRPNGKVWQSLNCNSEGHVATIHVLSVGRSALCVFMRFHADLSSCNHNHRGVRSSYSVY